MTAGQIVSYIIVPLAVAGLMAAGGVVMTIVRLSVYFTRTSEAVESTAKSNREIADNLKGFISETNSRLGDHNERLVMNDYRISVVERKIKDIAR